MNEANAFILFLDTNNADGHASISGVIDINGLPRQFQLVRVSGNDVAELEQLEFQWNRLAAALTDTVPAKADNRAEPTHVLDDPWTLRNLKQGDLLTLRFYGPGKAKMQIVEPTGEIIDIASEDQGYSLDQLRDTFKRQASAYGLDVDAMLRDHIDTPVE
jgi:hypothetical protein